MIRKTVGRSTTARAPGSQFESSRHRTACERHRRSLQRPYRRVPHRACPALRRLDRDNLEQHERPGCVRSARGRAAGRWRIATAGRRRCGRLLDGMSAMVLCRPCLGRAAVVHGQCTNAVAGHCHLTLEHLQRSGFSSEVLDGPPCPTSARSTPPGTTAWSRAGAPIRSG
jgi:hypothetical protein